MAPFLPSCISSTFCSHKQASLVLLVTLSPFFFPFLILCVPFLLLLLAPVSCVLFSLLLLYKIQVSVLPRRLLFRGRTTKGASSKGCQPTQPIVAIEEPGIHSQIPSEEDTEERKHGVLPKLDSGVPGAEFCSHYEAGGASSVSGFKGEKQEDTEALPTHDGTTEDRTEEKREHYDIIEGTIPPLSEEDRDREGRTHGDVLGHKGPLHSIVQGVESLASYKAPVEAKGSQLLASCSGDESVSDLAKQKQEEAGIHPSFPKEEDTEERKQAVLPEFDLDVQSAEFCTDYEARGERILPSSVSCSKGEKQEDTEVLPTHDVISEDRTEEKHEEHDIIEGTILPLLEEGREEGTHRDFLEQEESFHSIVQGVESPASYKSPVEAKGSQILASCSSHESVSDLTKQKQGEYMEEKLDDKVEEKQEEEAIIKDSMASKDTRKHLPVYEEATSSQTYAPEDEISTWLPSAHEHESLQSPPEVPYIHHHDRSSVPCEHERGEEALEDRKEKLESSHVCPMEEAWRELPVSQPDSQAISVIDQIIEEINTQDRPGQEPELSSDKESSLENLDFATTREEMQDEGPSIEPFEKEIQEAEQTCISPEGVSEWRKVAFAKETQEDAQPEKGRPAKELVEGFDAELQVEREEAYPCETSSAAVPSSQVLHGAVEFQDKIQEEQKLLTDINDIKKIVGYQGEPHASIMEQISALYMFLGMEPYYWSVEVDYLERARAEIELLKVVVGVK